MGVINPAGLYSGGQGLFNSTPFVQMYQRQEALKSAKDEALDKYYQKLPTSINPAGLRTQDTDGFMARMDEIRDFYNKNKAAIKDPSKDRGKAQSEYQNRFTDAKVYVGTSKQEELKKKPLVAVIADPNKRQMVMNDDLQKLHLHDLPLDDPQRQSFDFSQLDFNPKELTPPQRDAYRKSLAAGFKPSESVGEPVKDHKNLTLTYNYKKEWKPEDLKQMADKAVTNALTDRQIGYDAHRSWDIIKDHPDEFNKYNQIYKGIYGKDIEHPEELHAAIMVGDTLGETTRTQTRPDWVERNKRLYNQSLYKIKLNNEKQGTYEIDNVPKILQENTEEVTTPQGKFQVINVTGMPDGYKKDIFGSEKQYEKPIGTGKAHVRQGVPTGKTTTKTVTIPGLKKQ